MSDRAERAERETIRLQTENLLAILDEAWQTLSDICEYNDDPQYHLDIPAVRELMQRIHAAGKAELA